MKPFVSRNRERGILQLDLIAGLAILTIAIVPLGFSFARERQMLSKQLRQKTAVLVEGDQQLIEPRVALGREGGAVGDHAEEPCPPLHLPR